MTIIQPLQDKQIEQLVDFLESDQVEEGCLDYIAMHGFLTGLATGPESLIKEDWLSFMFDGTPDYDSQTQQETIEGLIKQQALLIQRSLYLGETLELPCELIVSDDGESNDLSDWCFGFIEAIAVDEDAWFYDPELAEIVAELILPAGVLSGQFDDPDLEHLSGDETELQELANILVENIQSLYLEFRD